MSKKTLKDFNLAAAIKLCILIAALAAAALYVKARYTIGVDTQTYRCLDQKWFIIDRWNKPTISELEQGDLVVLAMRASQRPANAKWPDGQVMVKRLLAGSSGTTMKVTPNRISFTDKDGQQWSWGTGLEAAELLGHTEAELTREETLSDGEMFLMGDKPFSFDSRYYGKAYEDQIIGTVLWAF